MNSYYDNIVKATQAEVLALVGGHVDMGTKATKCTRTKAARLKRLSRYANRAR